MAYDACRGIVIDVPRFVARGLAKFRSVFNQRRSVRNNRFRELLPPRAENYQFNRNLLEAVAAGWAGQANYPGSSKAPFMRTTYLTYLECNLHLQHAGLLES